MKILLALLFVLLPTTVFAFERETYYSGRLCEQWGGEETTLESGIHPDCETEFVVVEVDWSKSPKHYECLGQALIYAEQTGKFPVCVLLARSDEEQQYGEALPSSIRGVMIKVIRIYE